MAKRIILKPPMFVSLIEVLNYVMYDRFDFSGFDVSDTEVRTAVVQQGGDAFDRHWRGERDAKREIFRALRDGELVGSGRLSTNKAIGSASELDWRKTVWTNHTVNLKEISPDFWSEDGINWNQCTARNPGGEFADVRFSASHVMAIWKPEVQDAVSQSEVPASDRIVRRDDNSAAFDAAAKALDETISAVEKANDLGELSAEERTIVLSQLREGRKLFDLPEIKISAVQAMIVPKLRWLVDKLGGEMVVYAATAALTALTTLLKVVL